MGRLQYDSAPVYVLNVMCVDDVDHEASSLTIDVQVVANSAPVLSASGGSVDIKPAVDFNMGDTVYDVEAHDVDRDAIFYTMFTDPISDLFDIGYADGSIRVTQDLRQMCEDDVTFNVLAADSLHTPVGPSTVQSLLKKRNHRPEIKTTQTEYDVEENKPFSLNIEVEDAEGDEISYKMSAVPSRGLEYYSIDQKGRIQSRKTLDYEYAFLRTVDLYIDVTDGFCDAETFRVTVRITDVNEPPVIIPDYIEMTVYEGFVSVDPGWTVVDPDLTDNHEWSELSGGGGELVIDAHTGFIHSTGEIDIDPKPEEKITFKVHVKDKGHLKDAAVLQLTIVDKNDHVPHFLKQLYKYSATPCTKVGASLGVVHARDKDSRHQGNHNLVYSGSGQNISVLAAGDVILMTQCTPGEVETIEAHVTDQGTYPGPLAGVPTTVSVQCNECPEPVTTVATTEITATENTTTSAHKVSDPDSLASNLAWIMPALILTFLLAALLVHVISRHCCRACAKWRATRAQRNKCPKQIKQKSESTASSTVLTVVEMKPVPPVLPPVEIEPFLFGFWKETYVDRDQRHMPRRDVIPASVEQDKMVEEVERKEKEKEKEKRRLERQKMEEKYRTELEKYHKLIVAVTNNAPSRKISVAYPTASSEKKQV